MMGDQEFPGCLSTGWSRRASYMHAQVDQGTGWFQWERGEQEGARTSLISEEGQGQTQAAVAGQDDGRRGL